MLKIKSSEFMPFLAMVIVQLGYAGMNVTSKTAMGNGMPPLILVAYRQLFATVAIIPFAYFLERKTRPKITWQVLFQVFLSSLFGATLNQIFYFVGLKNSTPTISCALSNLLPAITFLLAVPFGLEAVGIKRRGGQAKLLGTILGIGGAMLLSFYHGPMLDIPQPNLHWKYINNNNTHRNDNLNNRPNLVLGPLFVCLSVVAMAAWFIVQAKMSGNFAAPYTSSALLCLMACIQCLVVGVCTNHNISDWSLRSPDRLLASIYSGVVGTALALSLMAWSIQRKGPLYVSVFSPLLLVIVALLSWFLRMEKLYVGTLIGSVLIVVGLYAVLWGKSKEMSYEISRTDTNVIVEQNMIDVSGVLGMGDNGTDLERQQQLVELNGKSGDQQPLELNGQPSEHQVGEVNSK